MEAIYVENIKVELEVCRKADTRPRVVTLEEDLNAFLEANEHALKNH